MTEIEDLKKRVHELENPISLSARRIGIFNNMQMDKFCPFMGDKCKKECNFFIQSQEDWSRPEIPDWRNIHATKAGCSLEKGADFE